MQSTIVDDFCHSLSAKNAAETTRNTYRNTIIRLDLFLRTRNTDLLAATESDIEQWLVHLKTSSHLSDLTIRSYLVSIKQFYKWADHRRLVDRSPAQFLAYKAKYRQPKIPQIQTVMDLVYAPTKQTATSLRDNAMAILIAHSGCRISEACGMRLPDLDFSCGEFTVLGKGSKTRICYLSSEALDDVRAYIEEYRPLLQPKTNHIWLTAKGDPLKPNSFRTSFSARAGLAGIPEKTYASGYHRSAVTPHTLRHVFATSLIMAGADLMAVKNLLGHESVATTEIYTHCTDDYNRQAHRLVFRNLTPPPTHPRGGAISGGAGAARTTTGDLVESIPRDYCLGVPKNIIPFRIPA